jgi:hypothetical protein
MTHQSWKPLALFDHERLPNLAKQRGREAWEGEKYKNC